MSTPKQVSAWALFAFFACIFAVVFVAGSDSINSGVRHPPSHNAKSSDRPCLDKYKRLGTHTACLSPSAESVPIDLTAEDRKLIVDLHNRYRGSVSPPATNMLKMSWDAELAMIAQAWAETCSLEHDEAKNRDIPGRLSVGQNIGDGYTSWTGVIDAWFVEDKDFTYNGDNNVFEKTGHYTQGVWADTNKVGCGASYCGNIIFHVCNYGPAGNIDPMNKPYKTGQACSECPLHCENNLCVCGDLVCENGGTMKRDTCQCQCQHPWLVERECKLKCKTVQEPIYCGVAPFDREGCDLYENVPHDCPTTCELCPYGDGDYKEGSVPLPNSAGTDTNNGDDNDNGNDDHNNTSVGCGLSHPDRLPLLLLSLAVGLLLSRLL